MAIPVSGRAARTAIHLDWDLPISRRHSGGVHISRGNDFARRPRWMAER
jgi:hypothetical protein